MVKFKINYIKKIKNKNFLSFSFSLHDIRSRRYSAVVPKWIELDNNGDDRERVKCTPLVGTAY